MVTWIAFVLLVAGACILGYGWYSWHKCAELWHYAVCFACIAIGFIMIVTGVDIVPW